MFLKNKYYYFKKVIPERICNDILLYASSQKKEIGLVGSQDINNINLEELHKTRNSEITWLDHNWIYKELFPIIKEANKQSGWNFEWDDAEQCQFTRYGVGQYYGWHMDSFEEPGNNIEQKKLYGKIRKLSMSLVLSHPNEYEGGELEFDLSNKEVGEKIITCEEIKEKGSLVVFPSFLWHRVKPVTKGIRHSLVMWTLGKPFK